MTSPVGNRTDRPPHSGGAPTCTVTGCMGQPCLYCGGLTDAGPADGQGEAASAGPGTTALALLRRYGIRL